MSRISKTSNTALQIIDNARSIIQIQYNSTLARRRVELDGCLDYFIITNHLTATNFEVESTSIRNKK